MAGSGKPRKVAIACQGGGSHAAFCAGALKVLLAGQVEGDYRVSGLSGTSGGAVCAALAWYGMAAGGADVERASRDAAQRLDAFWSDNAAALWWEKWWNEALQWGAIAPFEPKWSPYAIPVQEMADLAATVRERLGLPGPRREFVDLAALLEAHAPRLDRVAFGDVLLLLGAVDVGSGAFKAFSSRRGEISADAVLASAALPTIFRALRIDGRAYWDGLFSQNPPLRNFVADPEFADDKPDEIWVLQVNPQRSATEPRSARDIEDRRNELAGNLSLNQEIEFIRTVNRWLAEGRLAGARPHARASLKPVAVYRIVMDSAALGEQVGELDLASKLDRRAELISALMAQGETQARLFLPVRRYIAEVWREPDPQARMVRAAGLVAAGGGADRSQAHALSEAWRQCVIEIDDMRIHAGGAGEGRVELDWSGHGAGQDGRPLRRAGGASFAVAGGVLQDVTLTADAA